MKNVNFDSLTNIKAPEKWIENALNIPQTVEKPKPLFFIKHARTLAAVASLVFVSVISIVLFLTNDRVTPQIDPDAIETKATVSIVETDNSTQNEQKPTNNQNQTQEKTPYQPTVPYETIEPPESDKPQKPTKPGADSPTVKPTVPVAPTQGSDATLPPDEIEPTEDIPSLPVDPTEPPPVVRPTVKPTVKPSEKPTQPPAVTPTEAPTESPTEAPTEEPWIPPTENPFNNIILSGSAPQGTVNGSKNLYCMIYDSNGRLIGDSNLYSSQHVAYFMGTGYGKAYFSYSVPNGLITKHDTYTYYFYDQDGVTLFIGTTTI